MTDQNGCPGTASKTVNVIDVRGGKKNDKVVICHKPDKQANTLTIGGDGVADHLSHGDMLGSCSLIPGAAPIQNKAIKENETELAFKVKLLQNPSAKYFTIRFEGNSNEMVRLRVIDMQGRLIEHKDKLQANQTIMIGSTYRPGIYMVEIVQGQLRKQLKLIKTTN